MNKTFEHSMRMTSVLRNSIFDPKDQITSSTTINIAVCFLYIRNNFFLPAAWQYEKHYIIKAEQGLLDGVYTEV